MSKFSHIHSLADLDREIAKTEIKKGIIKKEISTKVEIGKQMLTPAFIGMQVVRTLTNRDASPSDKILEAVSKILRGVQASKYGVNLLKKVLS